MEEVNAFPTESARVMGENNQGLDELPGSPADESLPAAFELEAPDQAQDDVIRSLSDDAVGANEYADGAADVANDLLPGANQHADDELAALGLASDNEEEGNALKEKENAQNERLDMGLEDESVEDEAQEEEVDDDALPQADEAEEERPAVKKRTEEQEQREMQEDVRALVAQMEQAVDEDAADVLAGRPGTRKLRMLQQIDQAVAKVKMHDLLLRFGFIGSLKSFLEPLETPKKSTNGTPVLTLPHGKVRATVYRALQKLPIMTDQPEGREMLKAAGIGPVLSFYSKVKDENPANRRLVQDLLMSWMAPMIEEGRKAALRPDYEAQRRDEELQELKRRRRDEEEFENRETKRVAQQQVGKKVGDPGYRYHARVLRATRPDYIKAPEVPEAMHRIEREKGARDKGSRSRIKKATLELQRRRKGGDNRSSKVELSTKAVGNDVV